MGDMNQFVRAVVVMVVALFEIISIVKHYFH